MRFSEFLFDVLDRVFAPACANDSASDGHCTALDTGGPQPHSDADWIRGVDVWERSYDDDGLVINPATGLPMFGGYAGMDAHGNVYGTGSSVAEVDLSIPGEMHDLGDPT